MVVGRRGDAVLESRQPPVRPRSSDPYGSSLEKSILLCDGTIIRLDRRMVYAIIDYLLLRDPDYLERRDPRCYVRFPEIRRGDPFWKERTKGRGSVWRETKREGEKERRER